MNLQTFLGEKRGRTQQLAATLGVSGSLVTQWGGGKPVSAERCPAIEQATGRVVCRWDLRPEDWFAIWPELVGTEGAPAVPSTELEVSNAA
jgi:DNA-binding transcriptional regulator YdaS (Cro superfamily)